MQSSLFENHEWTALNVDVRVGGTNYSCTMEDLYREFKERLLREVVARQRSPHTAMWIEQELHDSTGGK